MGDSRAFGSSAPSKAHLVRGSGGVQGEIQDLRSDVDEGFQALEAQVMSKTQAQANIRLNTQPTATDTLTIGADIYEFLALLTDPVTTPGNIGVLRGASAAAARSNIQEAINGTGSDSGVSVSNGTESVVGSIYNTDYLHIEYAKYPGGPPLVGACPSIALDDGLTAAVDWDQEDLSNLGFDGDIKKQVLKIVVDDTNLANDFDVVLPFVPYLATVLMVTDASGVPDGTGKSANTTIVQARNAVTIDLDGPVTDPVATDIVYIEVIGF